MDKSKQPFRKSKRYFHRRLPPIGLGDRIDYLVEQGSRIYDQKFLSNTP